MADVTPTPLRGYIEGYYGRLLTWPDRHRLLDSLTANSMNCYFYAPKEDSQHRLTWRESYSDEWRQAFRKFCNEAQSRGITVLAGIAPGLDFDFAQLDAGEDHHLLVEKAQMHLSDGVSHIALCMDDIDENFHDRRGVFTEEGVAHATLANRLGESVNNSVFVVPRVYSNDIAVDSPSYPQEFASTLAAQHPVLLCGSDIVAQTIRQSDFAPYTQHMNNRVVVWDNLYANDYCPRRLFVGPWRGRDTASDILLNPTGLIETDLLLLSLMAASKGSADKLRAWHQVMDAFDIPDEFMLVADFFSAPPFPGDTDSLSFEVTAEMFAALEHLLWKWKSPLSREWYPFLMSLKQDLLLYGDKLPAQRIRKMHSIPLSAVLLSSVN